MGRVKIPVLPSKADNNPDNNQSGYRLYNGFMDSEGTFNKRFGISQLTTTGSSVPNTINCGIYYWVQNDLKLFVSNGRLYKIDTSDVVTQLSTGFEVPLSFNEYRAAWATVKYGSGELVAVTNGGHIFLTDGTTVTDLAPGTYPNAPTSVIDLEFMNYRLIALKSNSNQLYWSNVGDPYTWSALDFATSEYKSDYITAIKVVGEYLYVFGTQSIEVWYDNGSTFAPVQGGKIDIGCPARSTICVIDGFIYCLDSIKRVIKIKGQGYEVISNPVSAALHYSMESNPTFMDDAYGFMLKYEGQLHYVISSYGYRNYVDGTENTSAGMTLVYDIIKNIWYDWASENNGNRFNCGSTCYDIVKSKTFIAPIRTSYSNYIGYLDRTSYTDYNAGTFTAEWESGWIDFKTNMRKRFNSVMVKTNSGSTFSINALNHDETSYPASRERTLISNGNMNYTNNWGMSRTRKWRVRSSTGLFRFNGLEVDLEVMTQ